MKHEGLVSFIVSTYKAIRFKYHQFRNYRKYGHYEFQYREELVEDTAYVLANGPSLKTELEALQNDVFFRKSKKCVLNYFVETPLFVKLKPDYYFLADPLFFRGEISQRNIDLLKAINNNTTWPMSLFVPYYGYDVANKLFDNACIKVIPITSLLFEGFEKNRFISYKKGIAVPSFVNVTIMVEYVMLNLGCKNIRLYGVDHTFFNNFVVDDNNELRYEDQHFYGKEYCYVALHSDGTPWNLTEFLYDKYLTFAEHMRMRDYADYLGARIINCTKVSLIDAYERLSTIEEEKS